MQHTTQHSYILIWTDMRDYQYSQGFNMYSLSSLGEAFMGYNPGFSCLILGVGPVSRKSAEPAVDLLGGRLGDIALHGFLGGLVLEAGAPVEVAPGIKRLLEGVLLPAKEVVAVLTVAEPTRRG